MMSLVEAAYARWLSATPIERLAIQPEGTSALCEGQWLRMNARASSMLLNVMTDELKADMLSQRASQDTAKIVFRLYTWYQPGGSAERQEVLRRLQAPSEFLKGEAIADVLKVLRSWPRWLNRCYSMGMTAPDPTVMARGLMTLTSKTISLSPDATFRTAMLRTSLRLDGQPSMQQVGAYQRHLQAELEGLAAGMTTMTTAPRIQAVDAGSPKAERDTTKPATDVCRYFLKPSGCRRGEKCKYAHSMQSLDREARAKKCLKCGSEAHRQRECPVAKGGQRPAGSTPTSGQQREQRGAKPPLRDPEVASLTTTATAGSTTGSLPSTASTAQGVPWTLEALVQAAHQVVQGQSQAAGQGDSSPEKTKPEMRMLIIKDIRVSAANTAAALLDSGATHCLRSAKDEAEWASSAEVLVQLAGSSKLMMRINDAGSLLMPPTEGVKAAGSGGQTIVPLGELVSTLGYSLEWTPTHCLLKDSVGTVTRLKVQGGCPQMCELEALSMISRIEDRRRENLENVTQNTEDALAMAALQLDKSWKDHLQDFVAGGDMHAGLRALRDAPYLQGLPGECLNGLLEPGLKEAGWSALKSVDFLSRPQRRRLWSAKRWIVHMFAGNPGHYQMFQVDEGDTVMIELDVDRCKGQDVMRSSTWRFLLWGAMMGKLDGIVGGPPGRGGVLQHGEAPKGSDVKVMSVLARMLWLYSVAEASRALRSAGPNHQRPVAFALEHPAATTVTSCTARYTTDATTRAARSLWTTTMWEAFQEAYQMSQVTFDQQCMGLLNSIPTTIGTNIYYLMGLDGMQPEGGGKAVKGLGSGVWAPGLVDAMVTALRFWTRAPKESPRLLAFSPEQWKAHIRSNHAEYRRDCLTCVMSRGTGKRHGRVRHPEQFSLTIDLAGPVKPALDATSKGTLGKHLKYLMVARYTMPKEYVKAYTSREPPEDHGLKEPMDAKAKGKLVDPGPPKEELVVAEPPKPRRRIPEKRPLHEVEMRKLQLSHKELSEYAKDRSKALLDNWSYEEAERLVKELALSDFFDDVKFGVYRHGGVVGPLSGQTDYPEVTQVLSKMIQEVTPEATYTAMWVTKTSKLGIHKDVNNDEATENFVLPIAIPSQGGGLWVELARGDKVQGELCEREDERGRRRYGQLLPLPPREHVRLNPRRAHEVQPWKGERVVLIAYTPQCMGKLSANMIMDLESHGFQPPLTQMPEYFMSGDDVRAKLVSIAPHQRDEGERDWKEPRDFEEDPWEMFIEVDNELVKVGTSEVDGPEGGPTVAKVEVSYTYNIEEILQELKAPLEVTHTVSPKEAFACIEKWRDAITKEMSSVEVAIQRLRVGTEERRSWLRDPRAQRLPMKLVFTVKPNPKADVNKPETFYRRKARLVICGNFAEAEAQSLYTESAPSEAVRASLVVATRNAWWVGVLDIVTAFIRTPLGESSDDPVIVATPPRILQELGLITSQELWALVRALYGLRQSPMLWARYRDRRMQSMVAPHNLVMSRGRTITSWWSIKDQSGSLVAIILIYVDDYLILGPKEVLQDLAAMVQEEWETSDLSILTEDNEVKFLGMELSLKNGEIRLGQRGYVEELMRAYDMKDTDVSKIPLNKDEAVYEVLSTDAAPTPEMTHKAQQMTGELLWLSQRSRPDLSYACCILSSLTTRAPSRVISMAYKILKYVNKTRDYLLRVAWKGCQLALYPDAAFAPASSRSQSGWVIYYGGTPILWRSSRQPTTALSTAEAELTAILEGSVALLGVEAMLLDIAESVDDKVVGSDSMSALCISSGTGSWRITTTCGPTNKGNKAMVAMLCCMLMITSASATAETQPIHTISVDWDTAAIVMGLLMIAGVVATYEFLKWLGSAVIFEYSPGAPITIYNNVDLYKPEKINKASENTVPASRKVIYTTGEQWNLLLRERHLMRSRAREHSSYKFKSMKAKL
ncbi:GIP [Symbiodinium sp. CCMP2456]|nr:GIP [Symbiodinium sp. CCMP2456]